MSKLQLCLVTGANGSGKTWLNNNAAHLLGDVRTQFEETDQVRATFQCHHREAEAEHGPIPGAPSPLFYKSFYDMSIDEFVDHCQEVWNVALVPSIRGAIKRDLKRFVLSGVHLPPGMFREEDFPDIQAKQVLIVQSNTDKYWKRFEEREKEERRASTRHISIEEKFEKVVKLQNWFIQRVTELMAQGHDWTIIENDENSVKTFVDELRR